LILPSPAEREQRVHWTRVTAHETTCARGFILWLKVTLRCPYARGRAWSARTVCDIPALLPRWHSFIARAQI